MTATLTKRCQDPTRCLMLRQYIERCLSPCHPLRETNLRLLQLMTLNYGINRPMEIRVTRPFRVFFIYGDQNGGPEYL